MHVKFEKYCLEVKGGPAWPKSKKITSIFQEVGNDFKNNEAPNPENLKYVSKEGLEQRARKVAPCLFKVWF